MFPMVLEQYITLWIYVHYTQLPTPSPKNYVHNSTQRWQYIFSHCNSQLSALVSQKPSIMSPKLYNKIVCTFLVIASKSYYIQAS